MVNITEQDVLERLKTEPVENTTSITAREDRESICNLCPEKQTVFNVEYCGKCKCILLFKTAFKYARCPLNKWESDMPPNIG